MHEGASGCHCLAVRKAARWMSQLYDQHLAACGLTTSQFGVLSHVDRLGPLSLARLAEALVMDRTTVSRNVTPLQRDGLLEIVAGEDDRRRRDVRLTPRGRKLLAQARPHWRRAQRAFEEHYGREQSAQLRALLHTVPAGSAPQEETP